MGEVLFISMLVGKVETPGRAQAERDGGQRSVAAHIFRKRRSVSLPGMIGRTPSTQPAPTPASPMTEEAPMSSRSMAAGGALTAGLAGTNPPLKVNEKERG